MGRYTRLHDAAQRRDVPRVDTLVAAGVDLGARDTHGRTALIAAAHLGHDGVVRQLIAAGAPLDHVNNLHWTALIEAIVLGDGGKRHQAIVRDLLTAGASTALKDRSGQTPLALARGRAYAEMVRMLEASR